MKKLFLPLFFTLLLAFAIVGCKESPNVTDPIDNSASVTKGGLEILSDPGIPIAQGSGYVVAGTGLQTQPGNIDLSDIPEGAVVKQALLYWTGGFDENVRANGDNQIVVNGELITGESIGGPKLFYTSATGQQVAFETFRYDLTYWFNVWKTTSLSVEGMDNGTIYVPDANTPTTENDGAGVLVIYDDGSPASIQLVDGQDLAYKYFGGFIQVTEPQTFTFPASNKNRTASLGFLAGSCGLNRPNVVKVALDGYYMEDFLDVFGSYDGPDWDSPQLTINIPPNITSLTVQLVSDEHGGEIQNPKPASLNWIAAALSIGEECAPCDGKITQLTLRNDGPDAQIKVEQKKPETAVFNDFVSSGGTFTFVGVDDKGTLSTEISIYRDGNLDQQIHTSCSQDIFIGSVFGNYTVMDGYSRNGGKLCAINSGNGGGSDCDVVSEKYKIDKKKLEWEIKNIGDETVTIQSIEILWPEGNEDLKKVEFGKKIYDQVTSWNSNGITITQFTGNEKERELKKNKKETLKFEFTKNAAEGPYQIKIVFKEGCELVLDIPAGGNGGGTVCDSKITQTLLKYIGPSIEAEVSIRFVGKSGGDKTISYGWDGDNHTGGLTSGMELDAGDGYTVSALPGDFGSKFYVYISIDGGEYQLQEVHHTSCSVPYVAGLPAPLDNPKGDPSPNWEVVSFLDKN